jgi:dTDP-4-amino-4,6-dideoxygalactose transaminase
MSSPAQARQSVSLSAPATGSTEAAAGFKFLDLTAQFAPIREEVIQAITCVMDSQQFILGEEVRLFEEKIAALLDARHAIGCASGSDALVLALLAAEIGAGDEVITPPFTFVATAGAIARTGAKPVFVDIDPRSFNLDPAKIEAAITPRTRAILPVHLFGLPADMGAIQRIAAAHDLVVVEDAAQAIGARIEDRYVGTLGHFGCFSFFPSKNLGGAGDGGLVTTQDPRLADRLRLLRVHGSRTKYRHEILGMNSRLDALQAAILRVKLSYLQEWTNARRRLANRYRELFATAGLLHRVQLPAEPGDSVRHVYNQFSIRTAHRNALKEHLRRAGVPTEIYYPTPLHLQPAFAYLGGKDGQFPESEAASEEVLSLPIYPELDEGRQELVVRAVGGFFEQVSRTTADADIT